jgi:ParB-like chromosome segregation protein Spo0J
MSINTLEVTHVQVDQVQPYPGNPRVGNVGVIIDSIKRNGLYRPLYVQRSTDYILAGNHTYEALRRLDYDHVPVIFLDVDDDQAKRIVLIDNRANELGTTSTDLLIEMLESIQDKSGTGWTDDDLDKMLKANLADVEETLDTAEQMGDLQFRVIVDCADEADQANLIGKLESEGRSCRPLIS